MTVYTIRPYLPFLKLIQKQLSGLCCLHAAACLAHYEVVVGSNGAESRMIDLSKVVEVYCSTERLNLKTFVENDPGGYSNRAFPHFLGLTRRSEFYSMKTHSSKTNNPTKRNVFEAFWSQCVSYLAKVKVGLVETMIFHQSLHTYDPGTPLEIDPATNEPPGERNGFHSLLLNGSVIPGRRTRFPPTAILICKFCT